MMKYGSRVIGNELSIDLDWTLLNQEALDYFDDLEALHLSQRDGSISLTTQNGIKKVIRDGLEE